MYSVMEAGCFVSFLSFTELSYMYFISRLQLFSVVSPSTMAPPLFYMHTFRNADCLMGSEGSVRVHLRVYYVCRNFEIVLTGS